MGAGLSSAPLESSCGSSGLKPGGQPAQRVALFPLLEGQDTDIHSPPKCSQELDSLSLGTEFFYTLLPGLED